MFNLDLTHASRNAIALGCDGAIGDEVFHGQRDLGELADGEHRPDQREGRDDGVDAAAVRQARVLVGLALVNAPTQRSDDAVNDAHQVVGAFEGGIGALDLAFALDVNVLGAVDHDLGDGIIGQEWLQRAVAQNLGGDLLEQALALHAAEDDVLLGQRGVEHLLDGVAHFVRPGNIHRGVKLGQQLVLDARLEVKVGVAAGRDGSRRAARADFGQFGRLFRWGSPYLFQFV